MEAQSEHVHVARTFSHVSAPICMLGRCLVTKIPASELRRKVCQECVVGWDARKSHARTVMLAVPSLLPSSPLPFQTKETSSFYTPLTSPIFGHLCVLDLKQKKKKNTLNKAHFLARKCQNIFFERERRGRNVLV